MMLLRRITQHVKNQNWFAVFLDFIIVVVGVFIGIQVANWNEERSNRVSESEYIVAIEHDAEATLKKIEILKRTLNLQEQARKVLYDYSLSDDNTIDTIDWPELINKALWSFSNIEIFNNTFDSLTSSGNLRIIDDSKLVIALQDLSLLINEAKTESSYELNFTERFGDPILLENIDLGAVFQKHSLIDKRTYVPWITKTSGGVGKPDFLKTQKSAELGDNSAE